MKLWTLVNTTKGERAHIEEIAEGEFVTSYGIDIEVPVDQDHPHGRETILRQSFVMPDQNETEEEIKDEIEQIYVEVNVYELDGLENREQVAMWRMPLDTLLNMQLPHTENRPNTLYPTRLEIEIKRFKMSTMEGK